MYFIQSIILIIEINSNKMMKFIKKVVKFYFDGLNEMYGPAIRAGVNPFV